MTPAQAVTDINNDIFASICVGNDFQPDKTYYNKEFIYISIQYERYELSLWSIDGLYTV
jgi:hypothetical protein